MPRGANLIDDAVLQQRLWTPRAFGGMLACQLDPSALQTIQTEQDGGNTMVVGVRSLSGKFHAERPSGDNRRPILFYSEPLLNSMPVFGGNGRWLDHRPASALLQNCSAAMMVMVTIPFLSGAHGTQIRTLWCNGNFHTDTVNNDRLRFRFGIDTDGSMTLWTRRRNSRTQDDLQRLNYYGPTQEWSVYTAELRFGLGEIELFHNGVSAVTGNYDSAGNTDDNDTEGGSAQAIGGAFWNNGSTNTGYQGRWAELLAFTRSSGQFTEGDRLKAEAYVKWKWGLRHLIPVGSPYTSRPPLIGD